MQKFIAKLGEGYLPSEKEFREIYQGLSFMNKITFREKYTAKFSWSIITQEVISKIKDVSKSKKILEVAAGSGYLAKHLQDAGVEVVATNLNDTDWDVNDVSFSDVQDIDAIDAIDTIDFDIVLFSWCPYESDLATKVFQNLGTGKIYIHIGEGWYGCTANDEFFETIEGHSSEAIHLLTFDGINDYMEVIKKS